ncbi:hypothetical protein Hamer_G001384 [Homarus americanus]|uniref:Uncharacterized protein n=1 Tax=Homarus americanus TaxID=6706 RepID=A0A8J5N7S0_HOMAM|nr:hypothetical protein Hamer_G001384 [Homarus americanus]
MDSILALIEESGSLKLEQVLQHCVTEESVDLQHQWHDAEEDTDYYVQAAYVAQQMSGVLCLKRKIQFITSQSLCNEEMATCIVPLHVLTVCNHNSGFYGTSKKLVADRVQSSKEARDLLASCGTELPAPKEVLDDLEKFVIRYIYCDAKNTNLGEVRAAQ